MLENDRALRSTWNGEIGPIALAFDLDGVLVESYWIWYRVLNATLEAAGRRPLTEPEFRPHWGQSIDQDLEDWFPGRTREQVEQLYAEFFPRHASDVRVLPGAIETVRLLAESDVPRCVATNAPREMALLLLEHAGLSEWLPLVFTPNDVPRSKPAPDLLLAGCAAMGSDPDRTLMVGDSIFDLRAAEAARMPFHFFEGFGALRKLLYDGKILK